ncbi:6245_t:CDS:2 [Scutellospora calospora]|uniref:6245_t:CDS:1 n=1 Tax=Scutellospora calospora TaxID=85575 RepID=A0ACA9K5R9_9GLOM|nr:6245_t:CDS:2 [Scutellospora calospora]
MTTRWAKSSSSIVKKKPNIDVISKTNGKTKVAKNTSRVIPRSSKVSRIRLHSPTKHVDRRIMNSDHVEIYQPKGSKLKATNYPREQNYTSNDDQEPYLDNELNHKEIMVALAEDNITTKVASEYKHRMDEYAEEKRNCLRKLRLGFEKYQLIMTDLLEALDKNHSQSMRARKDFEKDIMQIQTVHQSEITRLHEEIEKTTSYFHKTMESAAKEFLQKPSITKQFKSLLKF